MFDTSGVFITLERYHHSCGDIISTLEHVQSFGRYYEYVEGYNQFIERFYGSSVKLIDESF